MSRNLALLLVALMPTLAPASASARKKPTERYHVVVTGTELAPSVPAIVGEKATATLQAELATRPEFVAELKGAPDADAEPDKFRKWLVRNRIRAFNVVVKLTGFEKDVGPPQDGKSGKILKVHLALKLLGTGLPDDTMALAGEGASTVQVEVGNKVRPRDELYAIDETLRGAMKSAVDDAVHKLKTTPQARPSKR